MTAKQSSSPDSDNLLSQFKATYTPLYRVLLILGTLSVITSIPSVLNIRNVLGSLQSDPIYVISGLISTLIALPLMISSIILLWHKHPMGIRIRLAGYAVSVVAALLAFFTSEETLHKIVQQALEGAQKSGSAISPALAQQVTEASFFGALYLSIFISGLFAWLWLKAWKKQVKADTKHK